MTTALVEQAVAGKLEGVANDFARLRELIVAHMATDEVILSNYEKQTHQTNGGPTHILRADHVVINERMDELAKAIGGLSASDLVELLVRFHSLLAAHNEREEALYEVCKTMLKPSLSRAVFRELCARHVSCTKSIGGELRPTE